MYVLYEDDGSFKPATIMSEADSTLQVEAVSGKRSKIKKNSVVLRFTQPSPDQLLPQAEPLAAELDPAFLWEVAPTEEFDVSTMAREYFGQEPSAIQATAMLLALHAAPVYFHRRGRGLYRPAPPEILEAALAAIEKKRLQAEQQEAWAEAMLAGELPEAIARQVDTLAFKPDKNSMEWKALSLACERGQVSPIRLLLRLGAWPHVLGLLRHRFEREFFPRGTQFPELPELQIPQNLPLAEVQAYSFDDITTTEIDDALSVSELPEGKVRVGIHIAAPALAVTRDNPYDQIARARLSTVYMPGDKIPMQPESLISAFSLDAGRPVPALSLYATIDTHDGHVSDVETRLEAVAVVKNVRLHEIDAQITETALNQPEVDMPYGELLRPLWRGAQALQRVRETIRGKPELHNRIEFSFYVDGDPNDPTSPVRVVQRQRGAPLDRLVAEYMILANVTWGKLLADHGVPGIYRSQQATSVRMSTHPLPHDSMGVPQYAWCTSPLRRYVDLVNQQQLVAVAQHGVSAPLAAPYKPKDADLFAIISAFEARYSSYHEFQDQMERFWCLRWLQQENITRTEAVVIREDLVRFAHAPFFTRVPGMPELPRGHIVSLDILEIDEVDLSVQCRYAGDGAPSAEVEEYVSEAGESATPPTEAWSPEAESTTRQ